MNNECSVCHKKLRPGDFAIQGTFGILEDFDGTLEVNPSDEFFKEVKIHVRCAPFLLLK